MNSPKIRFKGYTEDWEQRKVTELCSIATGKSNTQAKVDDGGYPFYVRSPIVEKSTKYLYDEEAVMLGMELEQVKYFIMLMENMIYISVVTGYLIFQESWMQSIFIKSFPRCFIRGLCQ